MTRQEIIDALSFCISDARFPREECGEVCPLYPAKGESGECQGCINNVMRNAAWMLSLETGVFDNTERALLLYIPMGYTRLTEEKDEKNTYVVVAMSDTNRSDAIGTRQPLQDGEKIRPVVYIPFEDWRQAASWSERFDHVAKQMKKEAEAKHGID